MGPGSLGPMLWAGCLLPTPKPPPQFCSSKTVCTPKAATDTGWALTLPPMSRLAGLVIRFWPSFLASQQQAPGSLQ